MKKTVLNEEHRKLNARMVEFGGWDMPVMYTNVIAEHNECRDNVVVFDTCHMGEFIITGKDAFPFLQKVIAKDLSKLIEGKCLYTVLCNENGGVVDDLFVYKLNEAKYMLVVNAGTIEKDYEHLMKYKERFEVGIEDVSEKIAKIDVQGPKSFEILEKLFDETVERFSFKELGDGVIISGSGYTGEKGFEFYCPSESAIDYWKQIIDMGVKPAGLGARDTLRLESCYSLYGHEITDEISPIEGGIKFTVSMNKDFIGKEALQEKIDNPKRVLVAFEMQERGIPRDGYKIEKNGEEIGFVTSGTMSPTFKKGLGLALISKEYSDLSTEIDINIREKLYKAKIVKRPFYAYKG